MLDHIISRQEKKEEEPINYEKMMIAYFPYLFALEILKLCTFVGCRKLMEYKTEGYFHIGTLIKTRSLCELLENSSSLQKPHSCISFEITIITTVYLIPKQIRISSTAR